MADRARLFGAEVPAAHDVSADALRRCLRTALEDADFWLSAGDLSRAADYVGDALRLNRALRRAERNRE